MDDEKRMPEQYGSGNINALQANQADGGINSQAEPSIIIPGSALRAAISNAERAVDDTMSMIQRMGADRVQAEAIWREVEKRQRVLA